MKQAEREDTWARVNAQAESVFKDDESMKGFLNFMANCTPQSTRNLLILYEQNTEITHPRTFDKWKEAGRSIRSGEKGYTFFADQEYTKEDGTIDQLPQGVQAQYVPKQRTIFVRNGMDETATICAIAREQAHASFDMVGSGYYRQAYAAQAYCAAYVAAQKFGLDTSAFHFDKVCQSYAERSADDKRGFLGDVKRAAYAINRDVQRSFRDLEQTIQPDEFSVAAPKPAKAAKAKAEKEPER